jgi:hypothetical protein
MDDSPVRATIHLSPDLESFGPHSVMQLIDFFKGRLSVDMFWPTV